MDYKVSVLNIDDITRHIYKGKSLPDDRTVFERIRFFSVNDLSWTQAEINPLFVVVEEGSKIIGISKIGNYNSIKSDYSISFFSIDVNYRKLGISRIMADKLFEFAVKNGYELRTSSYTYSGKIKLQHIFNEMAAKWNVKFTDKKETDHLIDNETFYDDNLIHKSELKYLNQ